MSETESLLDFKQLKWHCRRGMLELDLLLEPFLEEEYEKLDHADKQRFISLIKEEDQDMFIWFMQREEPSDPDLARIVKMILDRVQPDNHNA